MHNGFMKTGQALVIVLLVLAVAATVGLSIASRSVNEVNLSTTQDDSSQALSAAESGIEAVLNNPNLGTGGTPVPLPTPPSTTGAPLANYSIANKAAFGSSSSVHLGESLLSGDDATLFLQNVNPDGSFTDTGCWNCGLGDSRGGGNIIACWGDGDLSGESLPSLEVTFYYWDHTDHTRVSVKKAAFNYFGIVSTSPRWSNGFTETASGTFMDGRPNCGEANKYASRTDMSITQGGGGQMQMVAANCPSGVCVPLFMRWRMIYNDTTGQRIKALSSGTVYPSQGNTYEVLGTAGQTTRRVQVTQRFPVVPGIMDHVLFSNGSL